MTPNEALEISQLEGSSIWLSTLPLKDEKYALNSQEFFDAIHLRYNWHPKHLPQRYNWHPKHLPQLCSCGANFSLQYAMNCHLGGYIIARHDHLRNTLPSVMNKLVNS